jgi:hypothetical protein
MGVPSVGGECWTQPEAPRVTGVSGMWQLCYGLIHPATIARRIVPPGHRRVRASTQTAPAFSETLPQVPQRASRLLADRTGALGEEFGDRLDDAGGFGR